MPPSPPNPASDLDSAISALITYQLGQFNSAHHTATAPMPTPTTDEERRRQQTALAQAQAQMNGALAQLAHLETMKSDALGRQGYAALVQLMKDTQAAASDVCSKVRTLASFPGTATAPTAAETTRMTALLKALEELAQIAPTSLWQQASSSTSA
jgi:hypothetical protein